MPSDNKNKRTVNTGKKNYRFDLDDPEIQKYLLEEEPDRANSIYNSDDEYDDYDDYYDGYDDYDDDDDDDEEDDRTAFFTRGKVAVCAVIFTIAVSVAMILIVTLTGGSKVTGQSDSEAPDITKKATPVVDKNEHGETISASLNVTIIPGYREPSSYEGGTGGSSHGGGSTGGGYGDDEPDYTPTPETKITAEPDLTTTPTPGTDVTTAPYLTATPTLGTDITTVPIVSTEPYLTATPTPETGSAATPTPDEGNDSTPTPEQTATPVPATPTTESAPVEPTQAVVEGESAE